MIYTHELPDYPYLAFDYRRLGMKDKAAVEAASFADQKDDPTASIYALQFLRKHTEIASESVVWHTHELDGPVPGAATNAALPGSFSANQ